MTTDRILAILSFIIPSIVAIVLAYISEHKFIAAIAELREKRAAIASLHMIETADQTYSTQSAIAVEAYLNTLEELCQRFRKKKILRSEVRSDLSLVLKYGLVDCNKMSEPWLNVKKAIAMMKHP